MESFDLQIDPYRLDEEWVRQPSFYYEYASKLADARLEADESKNYLEVIKSEVYQRIATNPGEYGLAKTTEAALSAAVPLRPEVREATTRVHNSRHAVAILEAAVAAIDQRKRALEKLVDLHLADYYSKPRTRGAAKEEMDEVERQAIRSKGRIRRRADD